MVLQIMDISIHFNNQRSLVTVKVAPTRPPPNTMMYISHDYSKFESSYLGEVPKAEGAKMDSQFIRPQFLPKDFLSRSHIAATLPIFVF